MAIPAAFAVSSTLEEFILGIVFFLNLRTKSQQAVARIALER